MFRRPPKSTRTDTLVPVTTRFRAAAVGMSTLFDHGSGGRVYGAPGGPMFGVVGPFDGKPASVGNGSMFGFALPSHELIDLFHQKALELGGTDEGAPGQ